MAGPFDDPDAVETVQAKLDRILAQMETLNTRLDRHDMHIARTEKFQMGDVDPHDSSVENSPLPPGTVTHNVALLPAMSIMARHAMPS